MSVMDDRTRAYLRGRFRDYYRRASLDPPALAASREWGYIPWSSGGTTMVRHLSLLEYGGLANFLTTERPQHVYYSSGIYADPAADTMDAKQWEGSDLVFDLDADHLPSVSPEEDSYSTMLEECKKELLKLVGFLQEDFDFEDLQFVFSGGRGYHVHVKDDSVRPLDRDARREIVDYIRGRNIEFEDILTTESVEGLGRQTPAERRSLQRSGGWGRRVHESLIEFINELLADEEDAAVDRLQSFDDIGPERARAALTAARKNYSAIEQGNVDIHPAFYRVATRYFDRAVQQNTAAIDEPVTVDTHRLIRLPGSLHGGTGLRVLKLSLDEIGEFDPLRDAIPAVFTGHSITIQGDGGPPVTLNGETFTVPDAVITVPEYVAIFLMTRGRAEKEPEQ